MKKIPDEEWSRLFSEADNKKERERRDRKLFLNAVKQVQDPDTGVLRIPADGSSRKPECRRIPRKRMVPVDAELDLHERTREEADRLLEGFLEQSRSDRCTLVCIITGKGHHSDRRGVLRQHVENWIRSRRRDEIAWYSVAPRAMGGKGAWILCLSSEGNPTDKATESRE